MNIEIKITIEEGNACIFCQAMKCEYYVPVSELGQQIDALVQEAGDMEEAGI